MKLSYRPHDLDDWGFIRTEEGNLFAVVRRPVDQQEMAIRHLRLTEGF